MNHIVTFTRRGHSRPVKFLWALILIIGAGVGALQAAYITNPVITNAYTVTAGNTLVFNDSATNFTISDVILLQTTNTGMIFNPVNNTWTISGFSGDGVSGQGTLTLFGTGTTIVTASNSYSGITTIQGGTLVLSNALGPALYNGTTGTVALTTAANNYAKSVLRFGATNQLGTNVSLTYLTSLYALDALVQLNGYSQTIGTLSATNASVATNTIENGSSLGSATLTVTGGSFNGLMRDGGVSALALGKQGSGTLTLTSSNTFTGGTLITGGAIQLTNNGTLGSGAIVNNGRLIFNRSDRYNFANTVSGSGTLFQVGSGTTVIAGNSSVNGLTMVSRGALVVTNSGRLLGAGSLTVSGGSVVVAGTNFSLVGGVLIGSNPYAALVSTNTSTNTSSNSLIVSNSGLNVSGSVLMAPDAASESNIILVSGGTLNVSSNIIIGQSGSQNALILSNSASIVGGNITLSQSNAASNNLLALFGSSLSGVGTLTVGAGGSATLSMENGSSVSATRVIIGTNGTLTGGGTLTGAVSISGVLAPALSESLTLNGDLGFDANSSFLWNMLASTNGGAGTNFTTPVVLGGNLAVLTNAATLYINLTNAVAFTDSYWHQPGTVYEWTLISNSLGNNMATGTNFILAFSDSTNAAGVNNYGFHIQSFSLLATNNLLQLLYTIDPNLYVGSNSSSQTALFGSGTNRFYDGYVGYSTGAASTNNTLSVSNSGTSLTFQNNLYSGDNGSGNRVEVLGGGTLTVWENTYVGNSNEVSSNNSLLVSGPGSVFLSEATIYVSYATVSGGTLVGGGSNSMVISNEAAVLTTNLVVGGGGSLGNSLLVTGGNSTLTASGSIIVGDSSSPGSSGVVIGGSSTMTISDGAVVTASNVILGGAGATNVSLLLTGNGSALNFGSVTVGDSTNTSAGTIGGSATLTVGSGAVLGGNFSAPVILAAGTNSTGTLNFGTPGGSQTGIIENQAAIVFGDGTSILAFNQSDNFTNMARMASLAYFNTSSPAPSPTALGAIIQQGSGTTVFDRSFMSTFPADNLYAQLLVLDGAIEMKSSQVSFIYNSSSSDMGGVFVGYQGSNSMGYFSNSTPVSLSVIGSAYLFSSYVEVGHGYDSNGNPTGQNNSNSLIVSSGDNGLRLGNLIIGNGGSFNRMELSQGSTLVFDTTYATNSNSMGAVIGNYGNSNSMVIDSAQFNGFALYGGEGYAMTVGNHGDGNLLVVTNFGAIGVSNTVVGNVGQGNLVFVEGGYTQYGDLGSVMIGQGAGSSNNGIIVTNGASMGVASNLYVGVSNNANYLQVTGYDSNNFVATTLAVTNDLVVGYYGNGNSATVSDGASVNVLGAINVGVVGSNNILSIGDAGFVSSAGTVTVAAGNTLAGSGTLTAPSVAIGGTLSPVGTNSLTINGSIDFSSSSTYLWSLFSSTTSGPGTNFSAPLILNGALAVTNGATFAINLTNSVSDSDPLWNNYGVVQSWVLMTNAAGSSMSQGTNFTVSFVPNAVSANLDISNFTLSASNNSLYLNFYVPAPIYWQGTNGNSWATANNWSNGVLPSSNTPVIINVGSSGTNPLLTGSGLSASLTIGTTLGGNSLTISGSGSLSASGNVTLGQQSLSSNNVLNVTGSSARLIASGNLTVGSSGSGNLLSISSNAIVSASNTYIGYGSSSSNNLLAINGGTLSNGGSVNIGFQGSGTLSMTNGASVIASSVIVNTNSTLTGSGTITAPVSVTGGTLAPVTGSSLTINGSLTISTGTLNILLGGSTNSLLNVSGTVSLGGVLNFGTNSTLTATSYTFLTTTGAITNQFATISNTPSGYGVFYGSNSVYLQALANMAIVTNAFAGTNAVITGGSTNFSVTVTNGAVSGALDLVFTGTSGSNVTGSIGSSTISVQSSATYTNFSFSGGTNIGSNQTGTYTLNSSNSFPVSATGNITADIYDHASNVLSATNLSLQAVHVGYTNGQTNVIGMSNAAGFRVAMLTAATNSSNNISLGAVSNVAEGSSTNAVLTFGTNQGIGAFTNVIGVVYGDNSSLSGNLAQVGTNFLTVSGFVYSGQATWTAGSGNWTNLANWDAYGGTPGLDGALSVNDAATFGAGGSGTVTLNTNASLSSLTFSNGSSSYLISGTGTITLAAGTNQPTLNNFAGSHTITTTVNILTNLTVNDAAGSLLTIGGTLQGAGSLTIGGAGTFTLAASNSYTGATLVTNGTLAFTASNALGASSITLTNGSLFAYTGSGVMSLTNGVTIATGSSGIIANSSGNLLTLSGTLAKNGSVLRLQGGTGGITVSGAITGSSANSDLIVDGGTGTVTLAAANSYNGPTYIINGGTLNANVANALPTANGRTALYLDLTNNGSAWGTGNSTLVLGTNQTIASLTGATSSIVNLSSYTLTIGTNSTNTTFAGSITGTGGSLLKNGTSTLTLSGTNTYTGTTLVSGGNLIVTGNTTGGREVVVGSNTAGVLLTVSGGGTLSNTNGFIGYAGISTNNSVLVTGTNSTWSNSGSLMVGRVGKSNTLTISDGGRVINAHADIGSSNTSSNNSVLVTGSNSLWSNAGQVTIGNLGSGNSMTISNGGQVVSGGALYSYGLIGGNANSSNNFVVVTGTGSLWSMPDVLVVGAGPNSSGNSLTIANGGKVQAADQSGNGVAFYIGGYGAANSNRVTVNGTGSLLAVIGDAWVSADENSGNQLSVLNGASMTASNLFVSYVPGGSSLPASSNNSVLISGSSTVTLSGDTYVGWGGHNDTLTIASNGVLSNVNGWIGYTNTASNHAVLITGANSTWSNSGTLNVGVFGSGTLTVSQAGTVVADGGIIIAQNVGAAGTLNIGSLGGSDASGTVGASTISFGSGVGVLNLNQVDTFTLTSSITGSGSVKQLGSGTSILTGSNSYTGGTLITNGTLQIGNGGNSGTLGAASVTNNASLVFNRSDSWIVSNAISGLGSLTQAGSGTSILLGSNSYTGQTYITRGTLIAGSSNALGSGSVTIAGSAGNQATLASILTGTNITLGGPLFISGYATMAIVNTNGIFNSLSDITISGTNNFINFSGSFANNSTNILLAGTNISGTSISLTGVGIGGSTMTLGSTLTNGRTIYNFLSTGTQLQLINSAINLDLAFNGVSGNWNTATNNTTWNTYPSGPSNQYFATGENVWFTNSATVAVDASGVTAGSITFTNDAGTLVTLGGGTVTASSFTNAAAGNVIISNTVTLGSGTLASVGSGTLTLAGSNSSAGSTLIEGGKTIVTGSLTNSGDLYAGNINGGVAMVISNGGTVANSNGWIGNQVGSSNNSVLVTSNSLWTNSGDLYVGERGSSNNLTISGSSTVTIAGVGFIGNQAASSNNSVLVTSNSLWTIASDLLIGNEGSFNSLAINGTGSVSVSSSYIGGQANSSNNSVLVNGPGSLWTNAGSLTIGDRGSSNNLTISNSGSVIVTQSSTIGRESSSFNNILIVTSNSIFRSGGDFTVGNSGSSNNLTISGSSTVTVGGNGYIGNQTNSSNNSVAVTGAGSLLSNASSLTIGLSGSSNSLLISNGGRVYSSYASIGASSTSSNNSVLVAGSDSLWSNTAGMQIGGFYGGNGSLTIASNGTVFSGYLSIGEGSNSSGNSVLVTGVGSTLSNASLITIGQSGSGNSLIITNGGVVVNQSNAILGYDANSSNNSVVVSGANSRWTTGSGIYDGLYVGLGGSGNSLIIGNGGRVDSVNSAIGVSNSASNNSVLVTGGGSLWSNTSQIQVGGGYGGSGILSIASGGTVQSGSLVIAASSNATGVLNIGRYGSNDSSGTLTTPSITFGSGSGTLNFNQTDSITISAAIADVGNGAINQLGSGTTILTGSNSGFSGLTTITNGTLQFGDGTNSGGSPVAGAISNNAYLIFDPSSSDTYTVVGNLSGTGTVSQIGSGTTLLLGNNSGFSGLTTVMNGTLEIGDGITAGSSVSAGDFSNNALLSFVPTASDTYTVSGNISGSGSLAQSGSGTLILLGNNTYNGVTVLDSGTMVVNGSISNSSSVNVNTGSTLSGSGTLSTGVVDVNGGTLAPTGNTSMTINGNLNFNIAGSSFLWSLYDNTTNGPGANYTAPLLLNGSLSVSTGSVFEINLTNLVDSTNSFWTNSGVTNTWEVMSGTNSLSSASNFALAFASNSISSGFNLSSFSLRATNNNLYLVYSLITAYSWTGTSNSIFGNGANWSGGVAPSSNSAVVINNGTNGSAPVVTNAISIGALTIGSTTNGNNLTISGGGTLTSGGNIVVGSGSNSSSNTLTVGTNSGLTGSANLYVGSNGPNNTMVISNGATATIASNTYIGYGSNSTGNLLAINGGTLSNGGSVNIGFQGSGTLSMTNGASVIASSVVVNTNSTLSGSGTITAPVSVTGGTVSPVTNSSLTINGNLTVSSGTYLWSLYDNTTNGPGTNYTAPLVLNGNLSVTTGSIFSVNLTNVVNSTNSLWTTTDTTNSWVLMQGTNSLSSGTNFSLAFLGNTNGLNLTAFSIKATGNNLVLTYTLPTFMNWTGQTSTNWNLASNWSNGVTPSSNSTVVINNGTNGFFPVVTNATTIGALTIGSTTNGNSLTVSAGGTITNGGNVDIGYQGSANRLVITNGGSIVSQGSALIGNQTNASNNSAVVTGANSLWSNGSYLAVGFSGSSNSLLISNGGKAFSSSGNVGVDRGASNNQVLVTGANSLWSNLSGVDIGYYGSSNSLTISGGGVVLSGGTSSLGSQYRASNNIVEVTGPGSLWSNSGTIYVGTDGTNGSTGNRLSLGDRASVIASNINVAYGNTLTGSGTVTTTAGIMVNGGTFAPVGSNSLTINGNLSLTNSGSTYLWSLYDNTTNGPGVNYTAPVVLNGGLSVTTGSIFSINLTNSVNSTNSLWSTTDVTNNWVLIEGTNSLSSGTNFTLAFLGNTNGLNLTAFSINATGNNLYLTYLLPSVLNWTGSSNSIFGNSGNWSNGVTPVSNSAVVINNGTNGSAPVVTNATTIGALTVGSTTNGNSLTISGGGTLTSGGNIVVGSGSNSSSNTLTVGTNSGLIGSGNLYVGSNGPNNTMVISNGATATIASNTYIGYGSNSTGNLLAINGGTLSNGGSVNIGFQGSGTLSMTNGASVIASSVVVNTNSTLTGSGTITAPVSVTGGTVAPVGTNSLVIIGNLTVSSGTYLWNLFDNTTSGAGSNYTAPLVLNGGLNVTAGSVFSINLTNAVNSTNSFWTNNASWKVMIGTNSLSSGTNFTIAFAPGSITSGFNIGLFSWQATSNDLNLVYTAPITTVVTNSGTTNIAVASGANNSITQSGTGTTTVSGSNATSLTIVVNSGLLQATNTTGSLASLVNVTVNNGTFGVQATGTNNINLFTVNGGVVLATNNALINVTNSFFMGGGTLSGGIYAASNYVFNPTNTVTVDAVLTNAGGNSTALISNSSIGISGTTTFNSAMTYTGGTLITNATLQLGSGTATGSLLGVVTNNGVFQNGSSSSLSLTNLSTNITGTGIIAQAGTGTLTLDAAALNNFSGSFAVSTNGTMAVTNTNSFGGGTNVYIANNGTLEIQAGASTITQAINVTNGTGIIDNASGTPLVLDGTLTKSGTVLVLAGGEFEVNGQITGSGTTGSFNSDMVISNATVTLNAGNNNYVGPTYVIAGSTLSNGIVDALPTNTVLNMGASSDVAGQTNRYDMASYSQTLAGLSSATNFLSSNLVTNSSGSVTLTLNGATNTTYAGTITGNIALTRTNTGVITLTRSNSYSLGTTLGAGGIITRNAYALGSGAVSMTGGTLTVQSQSLQISSLVWNGGVIALPEAGSGVYLVSTGALTLTGTGTFNLTGASLTQGVAAALLGATNMSTNNFTTNDFTVTGVGSYSLLIYSNTLWIEALNAPTPSTPVYPNFLIPGLTPNQNAVATALNTWVASNPIGDQVTVLNALTNTPTSQWGAAYDQISPRFYQQMSTIAFNLVNAQNSELVQRMYGLRVSGTGFSMSGFADNMAVLEGQGDGKSISDPSKDILRPGADTHWGMFVDGNGIFGSANSGNMLPGYSFQSGGITTGLTYQWSDTFMTGIYAGYQGAYAKNSGLGTLIDNSVRFGLISTYGTASGKGFYADGLLGGGYNNYQISRTIQFGSINRTANSSPGAGELDSMIAAGYNWKKGNWAFGPVGSLQYTYFGVNGFNETGAQSLNLNNQGWNASSMISSLGANCAYSWQAKKGVMVVPQINLGWQHEFLQNPYAINSTMSGATFGNWSATPIRDTLYTGVGFTVEFAKRWNTAFFYNAAAGNNDLQSQNFFWSAGVKF